jgi:bifunctional ADP-heptose synthase (sugar kinase/adenylyltransferase)
MTELQLLSQASKKRVLFCGEHIIDCYHYVRPLGRPTKDAILSVEMLDSETFDGGAIAAAKHLAEFCERVDVWNTGVVIEKHRYVERAHMHKLFQIYVQQGKLSYCRPSQDIAWYDSVIVVDYGHGMADERFLHSLEDAHYLAVNVQTNSGNYGFNLATKYSRCDYLCVDEPEARLATQNKDGPIEQSFDILSRIALKVVITLGKHGAVGWERGTITHEPAFTDRVVDTMGAGDAFFALTALVAKEAPMRELLRIGNAAGAIKSQIVGHREGVTKDAIEREFENQEFRRSLGTSPGPSAV